MLELVKNWASINSFSYNRAGLQQMCDAATSAFSTLDHDSCEQIAFENGPGLYLTKNPNAPNQIFLGGHLDTVYPENFPIIEEGNILKGPGVTDMKGGLVILFYALQFELPPSWGYHLFLNPDEEIGSIHSTPFIQKVAKDAKFALIFEPTLPDNSYVKARFGSANYTAIAKGHAAHVGRNPNEGICANTALATFIVKLSRLDTADATVKVGTMRGGSAGNVISDHAECHINIRSYNVDKIEKKLHRLAKKYSIELTRTSYRPPKPYDLATKELFQTLGSISMQETGGVCDGNTTGALGVPTIDTMGAHGGKIHSKEEFLYIDSLEKKAQVARDFLILRTQNRGCGSGSCHCK